MAIITIRYVSVFNGKELLGPATVVFSASPGEIISAEVDGDAGLEEHVPADLDSIIEGAGCILLPALIDSFINTSAAETDLQVFASFGISTVLDMCSTTPEIEAMRAASESEIGLPSYLASGTVAAAQTDMPNHLYNLRETGFVHLPSDAESFVISRVTGPNRADFIKVLVDLPGFDEPTLAALVEAAHRHGKLAIAHATQTGAFTRALAAGFDVITPVPLNGIIDDEAVNGMAARGVACVPTLCMRQTKAPMLRRGVHGGGPFARLSEDLDDPGIYDFEYALVNVKKLHDAGVRICAGTEANQTSHSPISIGESLHSELELLVRAGLTNREALRAATVIPTEVFGLQDRGALQPGMRADMIMLEGNPLDDINATRRIRKVWIQGIEVEA
ncbi:putative hydrolase [Thelonectria olida]|uniref:Hydrolase n=1 Tax=Thelonectria olida TaxID=1576542 RepID=A0A9P8VS11_9HYPO|nr:putative hydrolase [Thelonectria olida]